MRAASQIIEDHGQTCASQAETRGLACEEPVDGKLSIDQPGKSRSLLYRQRQISPAYNLFGRPSKSGPAISALPVFKASAREFHQNKRSLKSKTLGGYPAGTRLTDGMPLFTSEPTPSHRL